MLRKIHQKIKANANVGNVKNYDITVMNVKKKKKTFIIWGENKEVDLESILSFDSEMSSVIVRMIIVPRKVIQNE